MPQTERQLIASIAAHESWAKTTDRTARTAKGRAALDQKFLDEADGDPVRADHLRKAHFNRMALKSAQVRRKAREVAAAAEAAEQELAAAEQELAAAEQELATAKAGSR